MNLSPSIIGLSPFCLQLYDNLCQIILKYIKLLIILIFLIFLTNADFMLFSKNISSIYKFIWCLLVDIIRKLIYYFYYNLKTLILKTFYEINLQLYPLNHQLVSKFYYLFSIFLCLIILFINI